MLLLLLLLLSRFSCVRFCATPQVAAHQAPLSLGFSRKNAGVGCHFLLQCMKMKSESEVAQSCPTLSDRMDCSLPSSSVHGIFQARVLEWGAIAFSRNQCLGLDNLKLPQMLLDPGTKPGPPAAVAAAAAAAAAKSLQLCPILCDPIDGSPPGSPVPGESLGKNTGMGCHFLLQCMKVKSESESS